MRICTRCKNLLPLSMFHKNKSKKSGYVSHCKKCVYIYARNYYKKTRKKQILAASKWIKNNPERKREIDKRYLEKYPEKRRATVTHRDRMRRAREKNAKGNFSKNEFEVLKTAIKNKCPCCGKRKKLTVDHIIPLSKGGTNYIENIQPLCMDCNVKKGTKTIKYI